MCIDESANNNEINCVDKKYCEKLVAYYQIVDDDGAQTSKHDAKPIIECLKKDSDELRTILRPNPDLSKLSLTSLQNFRASILIAENEKITDYKWPRELVEFYKVPNYDFLWVLALFVAASLAVFTIYMCCVFTKTYLQG
jgi:hypothetical protein